MQGSPRLKRQAELFTLADGQRGFFTAAQAKKLGLAYQIQEYHVKKQNWLELMRGVYRLKHYPSDILDSFAMLVLWSHNRSGQAQAVVGF